MRIALFDSDRDLHHRLELMNGIETVDIMTQFGKDTNKSDAFIISDRLLTVDDVINYKKQMKNKIFVYLVRNQTRPETMKQIKLMCSTHGIIFIPPYFEGDKLSREIEKTLFPHSYEQQKGRSIAFFGTHPGVGVTTIAMGAADYISKKIDGRICVLNLNPWNEGIYDVEKGKSLDEIYTAIKNNSLNHDQLFQAFSKQNKFYTLQGNRDLKKIIHYDNKTISKLIEMSEELFDLVILDVGAHMENALSIQGMISADMHYLVTTQERKGLFSFAKTQEQIMDWLKFDPTQFLLIINKTSEERSLLPRTISKKLNIPLLLDIGRLDDVQIERIETRNKYISEVKKVEEPFAYLARGIIEEYGLNIKNDDKNTKSKGILSLFNTSRAAVKEG